MFVDTGKGGPNFRLVLYVINEWPLRLCTMQVSVIIELWIEESIHLYALFLIFYKRRYSCTLAISSLSIFLQMLFTWISKLSLWSSLIPNKFPQRMFFNYRSTCLNLYIFFSANSKTTFILFTHNSIIRVAIKKFLRKNSVMTC